MCACTKVRLTVALWLSSKPGPVVQAGSLRRALQRVAWLAAETHDAAHGELLPQADPVHGHAGVSAQAGRVACKKTKQLWSAGGTQFLKTLFW